MTLLLISKQTDKPITLGMLNTCRNRTHNVCLKRKGITYWLYDTPYEVFKFGIVWIQHNQSKLLAFRASYSTFCLSTYPFHLIFPSPRTKRTLLNTWFGFYCTSQRNTARLAIWVTCLVLNVRLLRNCTFDQLFQLCKITFRLEYT